MPRKAKGSGSQGHEKSAKAEPPALDERIIERPDGFYWEPKSGGEAHGPFVTLAEAEADMLAGGAGGDEDVADPESLHEAESELGINEWIDPDTGGPAEDNVPRIEDH